MHLAVTLPRRPILRPLLSEVSPEEANSVELMAAIIVSRNYLARGQVHKALDVLKNKQSQDPKCKAMEREVRNLERILGSSAG